MCPEHSSHVPLTHVGASTLTQAGLISEVMSTVYPDSGEDGTRFVTSCSGDGEAVEMNVSANGGSVNVHTKPLTCHRSSKVKQFNW
jgi:hypothetical protein